MFPCPHIPVDKLILIEIVLLGITPSHHRHPHRTIVHFHTYHIHFPSPSPVSKVSIFPSISPITNTHLTFFQTFLDTDQISPFFFHSHLAPLSLFTPCGTSTHTLTLYHSYHTYLWRHNFCTPFHFIFLRPHHSCQFSHRPFTSKLQHLWGYLTTWAQVQILTQGVCAQSTLLAVHSPL